MSWVASKTFYESFGVPLVWAEKISTFPPHKGWFWGCRNFYQTHFEHFWSKKNFWPFFWVGKGACLEQSDAYWVATFGQKLIIIRSKGPGLLSIEFGGHLSKFEKWPNSSNFDKLTVDSNMQLILDLVNSFCTSWSFDTHSNFTSSTMTRWMIFWQFLISNTCEMWMYLCRTRF